MVGQQQRFLKLPWRIYAADWLHVQGMTAIRDPSDEAGRANTPPVLPAPGPPAEWAELVQAQGDRDVVQALPDELPTIDLHRL